MSRHYRAVSAMAGAVCIIGAAAWAQSEVSGALSQSLDIQSRDGDTSVESLTGLSLGLSAQTETSTASISTGASLSVDDDGEVDLTRPALSFNLGQDGPRTRLSLGGSFSIRPTTFFEEEVGEVSALEALLGVEPDVTLNQFDTERTSYGLNAGISTDLTARLGANFGISGQVVDYDTTSVELVPSTTLGLTSSLTYNVTDSFQVAANAGLRTVETDTPTDISNRILSLGGSFTRTINSTQTLTGGVGITSNEREEVFATGTVTETEEDLTFNLGYSRALPDGSLTLGFAQDATSDSAGETILSSNISAALERDINANTSFGLSTGFTRQTAIGGGDEVTQFRISPGLSWQLTRLTAASARYTLQIDDDGDDEHQVVLGLSRSFGGPLN